MIIVYRYTCIWRKWCFVILLVQCLLLWKLMLGMSSLWNRWPICTSKKRAEEYILYGAVWPVKYIYNYNAFMAGFSKQAALFTKTKLFNHWKNYHENLCLNKKYPGLKLLFPAGPPWAATKHLYSSCTNMTKRIIVPNLKSRNGNWNVMEYW